MNQKLLSKSIQNTFVFVVLTMSNFVFASGAETIGFSASTRYDDNVFRYDENDSRFTGSQASDIVTTLTTNLGYVFDYSKQAVVLNVGLSDVRYQVRSQLNNRPVNAGISWGLNASNKLNTKVNLDYGSRSTEFSEVLVKEKNTITRKGLDYALNYQPYSKLSFGFNAGIAQTENSLGLLKNRDRQNQTSSFDGNFKLNSKIGVNISYAVLMSEPLVGNEDSLKFTQKSLNGGLSLAYSPKTVINFSLGNSSTKSRDSINYNLDLAHTISPKSNFSFLVFQSTAESINDFSLLTESQGFGFSYTRQITPKIGSTFSLKRINKISDTVFIKAPVSEIKSSDSVYLFGVSYSPNKNLSIASNISRQTRRSDEILSDYEANIYQITFNLKL